MDVNELKKDLDDQLTNLRLSGFVEASRLRRDQREELERMEESNRQDLLRLSEQEKDLQFSKMKLESENRAAVANHERTIQESRRENARKQKKITEQNQQLFRENLEESSLQHRKEMILLAEQLAENTKKLRDSHNQEDAATLGKSIQDIQRKWSELSSLFESNVRFQDGDKEEILKGIEDVEVMRKELMKHRMTANTALGKLKGVIREEVFQNVKDGLEGLVVLQQSFGTALNAVRKTIKKDEAVEWKEIDDLGDKFSDSIRQILGNQLTLQSSVFQISN